MKRSTIYRRAAERLADHHAQGIFGSCCFAIRDVMSHPITGVCDNLDELESVIELLGVMLGVELTDTDRFWWPLPYSIESPIWQEAHDARMIGLLLAAELLEEEGR